MAEPKTQPTRASVSAYIDALANERMRNDCRRLVQMMTRVTGAPPVLWGTSIVGFDAYRYTYTSGTTGDWPVIGFAPRARDLTLYLMDGFEKRAADLARLGRHTHSKSCLHVKSLADIDLGVLETMLADSVQVMRARYPAEAAAGAATSGETRRVTRTAATEPRATQATAAAATKTVKRAAKEPAKRATKTPAWVSAKKTATKAPKQGVKPTAKPTANKSAKQTATRTPSTRPSTPPAAQAARPCVRRA